MDLRHRPVPDRLRRLEHRRRPDGRLRRAVRTACNGRRLQRRRTDLHGKGGEIPADYRFVPLGGGGNFLPLPHPQNIF